MAASAKPLSVAAALCALVGCGLVGCRAPEPAPERLVLVSLDTVRRDHLPTYGYGRPTAPRLAALAERAVVFDNAFAQHVNTHPSHASMFTGLYPHTHGSLFNGSLLAEEHATLAQILARRGFETAAFVSGATLDGCGTGLDRGFDHYDDGFEGLRRDGVETVRRALAWLRARPGKRPFFLFVHLFDAHGPYEPSPRAARLFRSADPGPVLPRIPHYQQRADGERHLQRFVDRYDAQIRHSDDALGALLDALDPARTVLVVLADHGETLGERYHALDHGAQAFDEQIRIPLVIAAPGLAPRRVPDLVETVDLLPTLLDLLGLAPPADLAVQGRSLLPLLRGGRREPAEAVFAAALPLEKRHADRGYALDAGGQIHAVRTERWKLVRYPGRGRDYVELYDLAADPGERVDLAEAEPAVRDTQLARLREWEARGGAEAGAALLDPLTRQHLVDLGYLPPEDSPLEVPPRATCERRARVRQEAGPGSGPTRGAP